MGRYSFGQSCGPVPLAGICIREGFCLVKLKTPGRGHNAALHARGKTNTNRYLRIVTLLADSVNIRLLALWKRWRGASISSDVEGYSTSNKSTPVVLVSRYFQS